MRQVVAVVFAVIEEEVRGQQQQNDWFLLSLKLRDVTCGSAPELGSLGNDCNWDGVPEKIGSHTTCPSLHLSSRGQEISLGAFLGFPVFG